MSWVDEVLESHSYKWLSLFCLCCLAHYTCPSLQLDRYGFMSQLNSTLCPWLMVRAVYPGKPAGQPARARMSPPGRVGLDFSGKGSPNAAILVSPGCIH